MESTGGTTIASTLAAPEAERAVLGAIVIDPTIMAWLQLTNDHFSEPLHRHIFMAMNQLIEDDKPLDEITICDAVTSQSQSIPISAVSKIVIGSPTSDNAEHWVEILEEHRRIRALSEAIASTNEMIRSGMDGTADEIHDKLNTMLTAISSQGKSPSEDMASITDSELARMEQQWIGGGSEARTLTGISRLDEAIGGLPIGAPTALGARPGTGKSTFLWNICNRLNVRGDHTLILSNEDRPVVASRLGIANRTGIERRTLLAGRLDMWEQDKVRAAVEDLRESNERYHTISIHGKKMRDVCREATGVIRRFGIKLVALDYIQNVPNPERGMSRNYGIEENLTVFETMIADEEIPGIIVAQIKRIEEGARPTMSDFKDSGSIEQKAKLMMALNPSPTHGQLECCIVKNSEGRMGEIVNLNFNAGCGYLD